VWTDNYDDSIEAFEQWWNGEGPGHDLSKAAAAVELIGAALIAFAGVMIALKTAFIAQLVALAFQVGQAVATAFTTAGAALAQIPAWIALAKVACRKLIQKAVTLTGLRSELARPARSGRDTAGRRHTRRWWRCPARREETARSARPEGSGGLSVQPGGEPWAARRQGRNPGRELRRRPLRRDRTVR
jgi:hypothetical protein